MRLISSLKTIAKVALQAKCLRMPHQSGSIVIMGNGPSLADAIRDHGNRLAQSTTMAVNFFANTPQFADIRPNYYILADPHFFRNLSDPNVATLLENLQTVSWPMTLLVPHSAGRSLPIHSTDTLAIARYNAIGAEGFPCLTDFLFRHGMAMPRPRNVLIPAIMTAITIGFTDITIIGADHTWTRTLSVDDDNHVVSIQPHFYKEDAREARRVATEYLAYPLHQILESMQMAFRSYHQIEHFARRHGIKIVNATPGSMIDAFTRGSL